MIEIGVDEERVRDAGKDSCRVIMGCSTRARR